MNAYQEILQRNRGEIVDRITNAKQQIKTAKHHLGGYILFQAADVAGLYFAPEITNPVARIGLVGFGVGAFVGSLLLEAQQANELWDARLQLHETTAEQSRFEEVLSSANIE